MIENMDFLDAIFLIFLVLSVSDCECATWQDLPVIYKDSERPKKKKTWREACCHVHS